MEESSPLPFFSPRSLSLLSRGKAIVREDPSLFLKKEESLASVVLKKPLFDPFPIFSRDRRDPSPSLRPAG